jgi:hypothetical protein
VTRAHGTSPHRSAFSDELSNVKVIQLHIVFYVGPPGWKKSEYKAVVNAHLVFDSSPGGAKSQARAAEKPAARSRRSDAEAVARGPESRVTGRRGSCPQLMRSRRAGRRVWLG